MRGRCGRSEGYTRNAPVRSGTELCGAVPHPEGYGPGVKSHGQFVRCRGPDLVGYGVAVTLFVVVVEL